MEFELKCCEWLNLNKNARVLNKKKPKSNDEPESLYLLQIAGYQQTLNDLNNLTEHPDSSLLCCLSSDQIIHVYDQQNLKLKHKITNAHKNINEIGFFKKTHNILFSCGDDGVLNCWDLRCFALENDNLNQKSTPAICIDYSKGQREYLCADVNSDDNLLIVGTNWGIEDSLIYIFDIRSTSKYLHKFCESHSKDVTQVKFDPYRTNKFCSSSVDGLVCLYDLEQKESEDDIPKNISDSKSDDEKMENGESSNDEDDTQEEDPDFMEQVFNTDLSVQKIGYLYSNGLLNCPDQLYAITFTNEFFVWDLKSHDLVYKNTDLNKEKSEQDEEYFFGSFYFKSNKNRLPNLTICTGDKRGKVKLIRNDDLLTETTKQGVEFKRTHRDVVRSSFWNNLNNNLYTAGEDGFLIKWELVQKLIENQNTKITSKRERYDDQGLSDDEVESKKSNFKNKYKKNFK